MSWQNKLVYAQNRKKSLSSHGFITSKAMTARVSILDQSPDD